MPAKKIVLTDSPELLAVVAASYFQREGFTLFPACAAEAAYELVEAEAPSMAILDLSLHGADGLVCCRRIKHDVLLGETPLLMLLPDGAGGELADACWEAGCDAVVERPLEESRLLDAACALLGISRRLERRFAVNFQLVFAAPGRKPHAASAINLNAGGMFMAAERLFPVGTVLLLELSIPGVAERVSCRGRVAWVNHPEWRKKSALPSGMGVQFRELPAHAGKELGAFFDSLTVNS